MKTVFKELGSFIGAVLVIAEGFLALWLMTRGPGF